MKIILCLTIGLVLLIGGALLWRKKTSPSRQQTPTDIQRAKNEQKLRDIFHDHIARAKAEGRREIVRVFEGMPSDVTSIKQVIRDYSLVRVKVKDKETTVSDSDGSLQTWYKLDVLEVLRQQKEVGNSSPLLEYAPSRFLPLLASEGLFHTTGGSVTVDGIVIETLDDDPILLIQGKEYLIAGDLEDKIISPVAMVDGIFRVEDTKLKPLGDKNRRLVCEVERMYNNDLSRLRSDMQLRHGREK
ncbi:MAG TPA: hypothetical protein VFV58_01000 [Blastocatellia bacterium]|nr:hypothetical protein [Blastocatellia bacterium]